MRIAKKKSESEIKECIDEINEKLKVISETHLELFKYDPKLSSDKYLKCWMPLATAATKLSPKFKFNTDNPYKHGTNSNEALSEEEKDACTVLEKVNKFIESVNDEVWIGDYYYCDGTKIQQ